MQKIWKNQKQYPTVEKLLANYIKQSCKIFTIKCKMFILTVSSKCSLSLYFIGMSFNIISWQLKLKDEYLYGYFRGVQALC